MKTREQKAYEANNASMKLQDNPTESKLECGHEYLEQDCPVCEQEYWEHMGKVLNEDRYER